MSVTPVLLGQVPCEQCWPTLLPTSKHYFDPSGQEGASGGAEISKDRGQPSEPAAEHVSTHGLADEIPGALGCCGSKESAVPPRPVWDEVASAFV
jgi:hypothetical protein